MHYVYFLKEKISSKCIKKMLCGVLEYEIDDVGELLSDGNFLVRYEIRILDHIADFFIELNIYLHDKEKIFQLELYNDLLFGIRLLRYMKVKQLIIDDLSSDPFQWILIDNKSFFLVEEVDDDKNGITINSKNILELSLKKMLKLLPQKSDIERGSWQGAYFVEPSTIWMSCLKVEGNG